MKRKNILKFVSLLGIGSFVMLAAASCTTATTPTPNPEPKPKPNPEPKPNPNPEPKPDPMPNPPSNGGGMNGVDTNPGNGGGMDNAAQQLAAVRTALTTLINSRTQNTELYVDYAKIQDTLVKAYDAAKAVLDNTASTTQNINQAKTTLETAINAAVKARRDFDAANDPLVTAYNALKETLKNEETVLGGLTDSNFATIKTNLTALYQSGKDFVKATLDPVSGNAPQSADITKADKDITDAVSKLETWKTNATFLATNFLKKVLVKTNLTNSSTDNNQEQPGNYSFVGYSVNATNNDEIPNWNFAQRKVWTSDNGRTSLVSSTSENSSPLTEVSWIYSLLGAGTKYSLTFNYYGPSTGYLYFPYKLVKEGDENNVALQYTLNGGSAQEVNFAPTVKTSVSADSSGDSNNQTESAAETMPVTSDLNPAPTVSDINIAKLTLSNLKFGSNTIEFSVPTEPSNKVAPMIGNMYLTSNIANEAKVYNSIFGNVDNSSEASTSVTVDILKGYSLATNWSTYVTRFMNLTNSMPENATTYLVGFIGGQLTRTTVGSIPNRNNFPIMNNENRTFTLYVNAPKAGDYHISGSYLFSSNQNVQRGLKLSINNDNSVLLTVKKQANWNTLGHFDTSKDNDSEGNNGSIETNGKKVLTLQKGLNKIVIAGGTQDGKNAPYIGNLTFTLNNTPSSNAESEANKTA
ncbi:variably expressed lipoprotein and hemagglutinin (VlhA) family protein [Mycoplasmoides gallisepticum CA06_2006.052-5-2P]|uniref:FIVAR domain-containing protein n=1 Tax=Mycoplasmoides gallisepticum TaxID=2096 RepID=UPI0002778DFA|nr:FIVAR domain-containing protein [Mycoplasmoides gallisepticum]AFP76343.1 variably expressed lipoprotein and hemagglutinin (VlhA) family protein [Mycoplasmoides gallisepticum VA94_7994-1-7P]AFP77111.1 variably expressed lipoprotein and hemagglutinin (VlhA) family protein [Mycoplasmoides gallisepticum NC95_13295-2-2P]AFP77887.1 variably expressed lipoprotein and hemagglutinin (VlhA) family protein [Mycoplasmoides gallisepticum NC96_1596-4-2P]AFP80886.1 variably expressed lipoprotein and hemagg